MQFGLTSETNLKKEVNEWKGQIQGIKFENISESFLLHALQTKSLCSRLYSVEIF